MCLWRYILCCMRRSGCAAAPQHKHYSIMHVPDWLLDIITEPSITTTTASVEKLIQTLYKSLSNTLKVIFIYFRLNMITQNWRSSVSYVKLKIIFFIIYENKRFSAFHVVYDKKNRKSGRNFKKICV